MFGLIKKCLNKIPLKVKAFSFFFILATLSILSQQKNYSLWERPVKTILIWNSPQRPEILIFGSGRDIFDRHNCPVKDCELVFSPEQFPDRPVSSYDAVLFNINNQYELHSLPKSRRPNQRYIYFTQEPPPDLGATGPDHFKDFFNWSMTYRTDADILRLYGRITPKPSAPVTADQIKTEILKAGKPHVPGSRKKEKLVAALISRCNSPGRREDYIKELRKHIPVDVYGWCQSAALNSGLKCEQHTLLTSAPECYEMMDQRYYFYLSFENSICPEYVTEKFFNIMDTKRRIIPVVYGGANYDRVAPPHSFINAMDYEPSQLAKLLLEVAANETRYEEYFWWKEHYDVEFKLQQITRHAFCDLCQKLHDDDGSYKSYSSAKAIWNQDLCRKPNFTETKI